MSIADQIKLKFRVIKQAQNDAASDLPPADARDLSDTESAVVAYCQQQVQKVEDAARAEFDKYNRKIVGSVDTSLDSGDIAVRLNNATSQARSEYRSQIEEAQLGLLRARRDYLLFRRRNELEFEPEYPNTWLVWTVMIVAIVVESAVNANFFGQASATGLLGGFMEAFMISLSNVAIGFILGCWPARYVGHRIRWHLFWALPVFVILIVWGIVFNRWVALYRDALVLDPEAVPADIITFDPGVLLAPMSFPSVMLMGVGLFVFGIAAFEGYRVFGAYPGYRSKHLRYLAAEELSNDVKDDVRSAIEGAFSQAKAPISDLISGIRQQVASITGHKANVMALAKKYEAQGDAVEAACQKVIQDYRSENAAIRQIVAPRYFSEGVELTRSDLMQEAQQYCASWDSFLEELKQESKSALSIIEQERSALEKVLAEIDDVTKEAAQRAGEKADAEKKELQGEPGT